MPCLGLADSLPIPSAVMNPQPTTGARHLCRIGLRAVMGLKPQTSLNSVAIHRRQQLRSCRQAQILEQA